MKSFVSLFCAVCFFIPRVTVCAAPEAPVINAKSMILTEAVSGKVLAENNADEQLPIASVTKIMTLLLIMEALEAEKISLQDTVPVSARAMSMGGSTMFLEEGEELSVDEMIKGIAVASANDGCVAMAEFISGSEEGFVEQMNTRAKELGMENTHFMNTNGLDAEGHYCSARDVAKMSAELILHEKIFDYTTIWTGRMHNDKFELANTNKLIRFYKGANGLKTGSTSLAGCCLSATAKRDGMQLIAVVLGSPSSKDRFDGARALLDFGFANYTVENFDKAEEKTVRVAKGKKETVNCKIEDGGGVLIEKELKNDIKTVYELPEEITAAVRENEKLGVVKFIINGETVEEREVLAAETVDKKSFFDYFIDVLDALI